MAVTATPAIAARPENADRMERPAVRGSFITTFSRAETANGLPAPRIILTASHLRLLADTWVIEDIPERAHGRERWWRRRTPG
jgi:hypothetical protein